MSAPAGAQLEPTPDPLEDGLDTAARHASTRVPVARPDDRVSAALDALRGRQFDSAAVVAVCTAERLVGLVTIERLLAADPGAAVGSVMDRRPPVVSPGTDQERAAWQAVQHGEPGLAVVDDDGRFRGLIPPQRLLEILLEEHDEDMARIGGFLRSTASARAASVESIPRRLWHRLPWLVLGLGGAMVAATMMGAFEEQLSKTLAVAYFIPGVVYLAAAVGTQTQALLIRGLSVGVRIGGVAGREALTGVLVGALLAAVMLPLVAIAWGDLALAVAVAVSVFAASSVATVVAMALPWVLSRLGRDPAFGSGPVATVIQDLLSILIYFTVVTIVLP